MPESSGFGTWNGIEAFEFVDGVRLHAIGGDQVGRAPGEVLGPGEHRAIRTGFRVGQMVDRVHRRLDGEPDQHRRQRDRDRAPTRGRAGAPPTVTAPMVVGPPTRKRAISKS